ncbi:hypothetical protein QO010_004142 [Caulobacter ginsengisoli]|uniref:Short-chain dehydrogenase n=1 Tax=Caulobacter ginsengisoli TaxID=400775 RepID=A0ABU0IZ72_9CAUL|nr:hypothetical protein [Caulobacter ginsengisoli]MDQ0466349.1 hypothetical protein [Caulobacter ginsengisoli]
MAARGSSLVIGGTGMLAQATRWLADRSTATLLVARRASGFAPGDRRFAPLDSDWTGPTFRDDLVGALSRTPRVDRALLWLHEPEPILAWLLPLLPQARVVLVLGSLDGQPQAPAGSFISVRLGSQPTTGGGWRWLTDQEISQGAIAALTSGRSGIVGELRRV